MPIVDGLTSTKMIRSFEKTSPAFKLSRRAARNGRVLIFAVSASLLERERQTYIDAGFDGWILKPIDFKRLNTLFLGMIEDETRNSCLYKPGKWEQGGFFNRRQPSALKVSTSPTLPVTNSLQEEGSQSIGANSIHSSESGSITPKTEPSRKPLVHDERLDPISPTKQDS